jgi:leucyl-tRNA---protein transferase
MEPSVTFVSDLSACQYVPQRVWQLRYEVTPALGPHDCLNRLRDGWRRFGPIVFRPAEYPSCHMCQSLRVPVNSFRPNRSQRRAWKRNEADVTIRIGRPAASPQKLDLYGHHAKGWPAAGAPDLTLSIAHRAGQQLHSISTSRPQCPPSDWIWRVSVP